MCCYEHMESEDVPDREENSGGVEQRLAFDRAYPIRMTQCSLSY